MYVEGVAARNTYIPEDDMVLSQVNHGESGTFFLFTPRDDHLALDVLEPAVSCAGQVLLAGGLRKLDIARVEVVYL